MIRGFRDWLLESGIHRKPARLGLAGLIRYWKGQVWDKGQKTVTIEDPDPLLDRLLHPTDPDIMNITYSILFRSMTFPLFSQLMNPRDFHNYQKGYVFWIPVDIRDEAAGLGLDLEGYIIWSVTAPSIKGEKGQRLVITTPRLEKDLREFIKYKEETAAGWLLDRF
jgi:hypothetical protein